MISPFSGLESRAYSFSKRCRCANDLWLSAIVFVVTSPHAVIASAAKQSLTINVWDSRGKKIFAPTSVVALLTMT
jgi:hypothetical protein